MLNERDSKLIHRGERLTHVLCRALRHTPEQFLVSLNNDGWADLEILHVGLLCRYSEFADVTIQDIVMLAESQMPKRFEVVGGRIRALYGHSVAALSVSSIATPPPVLYHGTTEISYRVIAIDGLKPMGRCFAHLTSWLGYAWKVAHAKGGTALVVTVNARSAIQDGIAFQPCGQP